MKAIAILHKSPYNETNRLEIVEEINIENINIYLKLAQEKKLVAVELTISNDLICNSYIQYLGENYHYKNGNYYHPEYKTKLDYSLVGW